MAEITGLSQLLAKLANMAAKANRDANFSVVVGFTAAYSIWVHENMQAVHPTGQAKFLEEPYRTGQPQMMQIIVSGARSGKTLGQSTLMAGLWLQGEAQRRCPVDTGNMRASAFTRLDVGV